MIYFLHMATVPNHYMTMSIINSVCVCVSLSKHTTPEIPVILTPPALWIYPIHPDALRPVGVLIIWKPLAWDVPIWTA